MKERGKAVETYSVINNHLPEPEYYNYSSSSDLPCPKHPSSSAVGICSHCLKDRLMNLVCSDCGEQRVSSCSCSDFSSYRNSCAAELGSVGRISFLIENETKHSRSKPKSDQVVLLKRSNSSCVGGGVKRKSGLWRIGFGRLFRKKRDKGCDDRSGGGGGGGLDETSGMWVFDYMGVSRSRSLCSFRGGNFYDPEDQNSGHFAFSSAKISDVNGGPMMDSERLSGFSETEPRKNGLKGVLDGESGLNGTNRSVFPIKESDFSCLDGSGFIDLKLDLSSESKPEFSAVKTSDLSVSSVSDFGSLRGGDFLGHHECCGGSFGITVNETGIKKDKKGHKVWRWIFRHHPNWKSSASKKNENHV